MNLIMLRKPKKLTSTKIRSGKKKLSTNLILLAFDSIRVRKSAKILNIPVFISLSRGFNV
jgi:hypothetical protein